MTQPERNEPARRGMSVRLAISIVAVMLVAVAYAPPASIAASNCSTTTGPTGYTVQTCLTPSGGVVQGPTTVGLTVTISSTTVRPAAAIFCLDGSLSTSPTCLNGGPGYLLRDFHFQSQPSTLTSVWSFSLPTAHWIDGTHSILAVASMRDGTQTTPVSVSVTFKNGNSSQPTNTASPTIRTGTTPAAGAPLIVSAVGDGAAGESKSLAVVNLVKSWSPNLFLYLGDVYQDGSYSEFTNWYGGTYGSLNGITDPVIGNHEYLSADDPAIASHVAYFDYWNNLPHYYSFNAGGWHFIALDANQHNMGTTAWNAQLSWLRNDLAAHPTGCMLVYWHQPAFNIGSEPVPVSAASLWSLVAGHATLVLNGHDHTYQRWTAMDAYGNPSASGTVEVIDGTGGHAAGSLTKTDSRVLADSTTAGALKLTLGSASAGLQFISTSGSIIDSTTLSCL